MLWSLLFAPLLVAAVLGAAPSGPWDAFNLAPESRDVYPHAVHEYGGDVVGADGLVAKGSATFSGNGAYVTLDFGLEVGGLISMTFDDITFGSSIALAFTESPLFIRPLESDDSVVASANMSYDGALLVSAPLETGFWTQPSARLRGGFRYLTVTSTSGSNVTISNVSCAISFMPHFENLRNYSGYFYASDPAYSDADFLTKIWYSGAYTVQTDTIAVNSGREPYVSSPGWLNNATIGVAGPIIVDGAKRDRTVWPGDLGIAVPTQFVSTNDLISTRNALSTLFSLQNPETGQLPYSGPVLNLGNSDTYHAWSLIGAYNYHLYSGDTEWLEEIWANYTKAVQYLEGLVDDTGLLNVSCVADWGRLWQGGHNSEANAIYYKVLTNSAELSGYLGDSDLSEAWLTNASALKTTFNNAFWVDSEGMYKDNLTSFLFPQDGNSLAVLFNLTESMEQAAAVSEGLTRYWNEIGSVSPELPDTVAPFIGGFEIGNCFLSLQAHFVAGQDSRAMDFLHREWGYMLYTPLSVQSTMLEGYTANGSLYYRSYDGYDYDASYTSHSHGWSTGATSALTYYVLGLTVTSPNGQTWSVAPHTSDLSSAEGGFETALGWYGVQWSSRTAAFNISISTPDGTSGIVQLPMNGTVTVDGSAIDGNGFLSIELDGGNHTIRIQN